MNSDFKAILGILEELKSDYASSCTADLENPEAPVTERDIVADIYGRLKGFCHSKGFQVHCEIKPASSSASEPKALKRLPRIDIVVLSDMDGASWLAEAKDLQNKYAKGEIEARFSSVPLRFLHTAIEVKIQSRVDNAKKDIDTLADIRRMNSFCNCYFVLLNVRGKAQDHDAIAAYGLKRGILVVEHTGKR